MNASLRKTGALFMKDVADFFKNPTMLVVSLMPIAFMLLYRFMIGDATADAGLTPEQQAFADKEVLKFMLGTALCLTVGMAGSMTIIYGIAEEKEKHTLRTLMLANVTAGNVLAAKTLLALVVIVAVEAACFFAAGGQMQWFGTYLALGVLGALPLILVSLVLGLASRDQTTAGVFGVPLLLLAMIPMFELANETIAKISVYTPCGGIYKLMGMAIDGSVTFDEALMPLAVTAAWIVVGAILFAVLYKKLTRDN
ncbi:ABC transporter permease [uncultured Slackia sp.]|uniref:ABC transporter permease n=1 Tax=uncultured Slackia sp. TaxID=665903 RepID=UPI0025DE44AE|nr:ABC transporter permease [uncultured Slackia sp.]